MSPSMFVLAVVALLATTSFTQPIQVNVVDETIIQGGMDAHVRQFAVLPPAPGRINTRIMSMTSLGSDIFACTLSKIYRIFQDGSFIEFMDVESVIPSVTGRELYTSNFADGGLRSLAFHPNFAQNNLFYITAVETRPLDISPFKYITDFQNPAEADSVLIEFEFDPATQQPRHESYRSVFRIGMETIAHTIKEIAFHDGLLYIGHGDAGPQDASNGGGQLSNALGKILRINPLRADTEPYSIPPDNPFVGDDRMIDEVWALGFRNPHTICFGVDGALYSSDVGRDNVEEINMVQSGRNYGWAAREGTFIPLLEGGIGSSAPLPADDARFGLEYPVIQYGHLGEAGRTFTGAAVAGGCPIENGSPMSGSFVFSNFPFSGELFISFLDDMRNAVTRGDPTSLTQATIYQSNLFFDHDNDPATPPLQFATISDIMRSDPEFAGQARVDVRFGRGSQGEIYISSKGNGRIYLVTSSLPGGPGGRTV